ncbi:M14 family metallopeptidase [Ramlibacter sp.]|uniref:M14 family metallopeptidase n=1 Tax=Ramlibacter sp. TaxID=1917967 RepID=UPI003D0AB031
MNAGDGDPFSASYAEARRKFLEAAHAAGLAVESIRHPEVGVEGEELAMDLARDGAPDAQRLLIVSSGCHGVEGYCGSGIQVDLLRDPGWRASAQAARVAVLYIHGLNPYGFSHVRRTTHENVDLNRNFHDFGQPLPVNKVYRDLHPLMVPATWPPPLENGQAIAAWIGANGMPAYQAAISGGQHEYADGLFYGGTSPTWSNMTLREVLRAHGRRAAHIAWIDIHTGLGPSGVGERIHAGRDDPTLLARVRKWWGGEGKTPVTSIYDGSSSSAKLTGMMWTAIHDECPQAEYTGIALEYGTVPPMEALQALRAEQWHRQHPEATPEQARQVREQVMSAFFTDTPAWKERILAQGREVVGQAVAGLAES